MFDPYFLQDVISFIATKDMTKPLSVLTFRRMIPLLCLIQPGIGLLLIKQLLNASFTSMDLDDDTALAIARDICQMQRFMPGRLTLVLIIAECDILLKTMKIREEWHVGDAFHYNSVHVMRKVFSHRFYNASCFEKPHQYYPLFTAMYEHKEGHSRLDMIRLGYQLTTSQSEYLTMIQGLKCIQPYYLQYLQLIPLSDNNYFHARTYFTSLPPENLSAFEKDYPNMVMCTRMLHVLDSKNTDNFLPMINLLHYEDVDCLNRFVIVNRKQILSLILKWTRQTYRRKIASQCSMLKSLVYKLVIKPGLLIEELMHNENWKRAYTKILAWLDLDDNGNVIPHDVRYEYLNVNCAENPEFIRGKSDSEIK